MHEVIVGNIGAVFTSDKNSGRAWRDAVATYNTYVDYSKSGYGRASGESVLWLQDGVIVKEHIGEVEMEVDFNYN